MKDKQSEAEPEASGSQSAISPESAEVPLMSKFSVGDRVQVTKTGARRYEIIKHNPDFKWHGEVIAVDVATLLPHKNMVEVKWDHGLNASIIDDESLEPEETAR